MDAISAFDASICGSPHSLRPAEHLFDPCVERLEAAFNKMVLQAEQGTLRNRQTVERRIGRLLERNSRAASLFEVRVDEHGSGQDVRVRIQVHKDHTRYAWAFTTSGSYLLRTNWCEGIPTDIWKTAMQLTQMEDAFRITKSDLGIRPIAHQ